MHHFRYNIVNGLGAIVFVAVGLAALREADDLWDSWLFSLALSLLLFALLLAAHRTGDKRAFWIGFALFGWCYLVLSLIAPTESRLITTKALAYLDQAKRRANAMRVVLNFDRMRAYNLSANDIIKALEPSNTFHSPGRLPWSTQVTGDILTLEGHYDATLEGRYDNSEQWGNVILKANSEGEILRLKDVAKVETVSSFYSSRAGAGTTENFVRIGHSLFTLLAGWLGGMLSRRLGRVPEEGG